MPDNVDFRIRLGAEDKLSGDADKGIRKLNDLDRTADRINKRLESINRKRADLARQIRDAAFNELPVQERLLRLRERQVQIEQRLAAAQGNNYRTAALKLRQQQIGAEIAAIVGAGAAPSALQRLLNKVVPRGEKGAAAAAALGGGAVAGVGVGALLASAAALRALTQQAMELNTASKEAAEELAREYEWSSSATEALSNFGTMFQTLFAILKKGAAETFGFISGVYLKTQGSVAAGAGWVAGLFGGGKSIREFAEDQQTKALFHLPEWAGGVGGSGEVDASKAATRAKVRIEQIEEDLRHVVKTPKSRASSEGAQSFFPQVDELARVGIFRGGRPNDFSAGIKETNSLLKEIRTKLGTLPTDISKEL